MHKKTDTLRHDMKVHLVQNILYIYIYIYSSHIRTYLSFKYIYIFCKQKKTAKKSSMVKSCQRKKVKNRICDV